ncbi:MAG: DUF503 domain-containing protein [Syntrophomonadaceae bacterium]|nr:DUF503 domain-containing protein [Syntrophomonadaceae bacterium]
MIVGTCVLEVYIGDSQSLKDKRRVIKSAIDQIKNNFNVSIAEIGNLDQWQRATLGIAVVSQDTVLANQILTRIISYLEYKGTMEIIDYSIELL